MKRVFLIHGWEGTPDNHWFPWLKRELEARYVKVYVPAMPHTLHPDISEWLSFLSEWVGKVDEETCFVGHSLGCITVVKYLEGLKENACVGNVVLVAGFKDDIGEPEIKNFTESVVDFSRVKAHGARFVSIISDNDTSVPVAASLALAHSLDAKVEILKGKGHFTRDGGVLSLPEVLENLLR